MSKSLDEFSESIKARISASPFLARVYEKLSAQSDAVGYQLKCEEGSPNIWMNEPHIVFVISKNGRNIHAIHATNDYFREEHPHFGFANRTAVYFSEKRIDKLAEVVACQSRRNSDPAYDYIDTDTFAQQWHLEGPEQRASFFKSSNPNIRISFHDYWTSSVPSGAVAMRVKYYDSRKVRFPNENAPSLVHANIYYFSESRELGIERISIAKANRGIGHLESFVGGLMEMAEAQNAQRLTFLAGEALGPQIWARIGAHVSDERVYVPLDILGLNKGN